MTWDPAPDPCESGATRRNRGPQPLSRTMSNTIKPISQRRGTDVYTALTPAQMDLLDQLRARLGGVPRSEAIRRAIELAALAAVQPGGGK